MVVGRHGSWKNAATGKYEARIPRGPVFLGSIFSLGFVERALTSDSSRKLPSVHLDSSSRLHYFEKIGPKGKRAARTAEGPLFTAK
ncbi:hypothetical protein CDAR_101901 [Caerostris darwini]|uniref:Ribosomal protein L2 n=1 Tax=Caerostris darwini TaxID=1538125 RepID=A0AAV4TH42_9ARAC|nr:hypothetical protein CDAR_101901 [Caerostris darwini]